MTTKKPGKHGTLYLFRVRYTDDGDDGCPVFSSAIWAYDREHAIERWLESSDDEGWRMISCARVPNVPAAVPRTHTTH